MDIFLVSLLSTVNMSVSSLVVVILSHEQVLGIILLTVCSCHVTYAFQSESTLCSCLNVKELLARSRRET